MHPASDGAAQLLPLAAIVDASGTGGQSVMEYVVVWCGYKLDIWTQVKMITFAYRMQEP